MHEAIEDRIQELVTLTKGSYQDIKNVTSIEFKRTPFSKTKHNYFVFISNLTVDKVIHMLNFLSLCEEG